MYGNYGYGGMGGGMGMMGGGNEMMIIALCCVCCICLCCVVGVWYSGAACSSGFGRDCKPKVDTTPYVPPASSEEDDARARPSMDICTEEWGKTVRKDNDPRPPIRPEYCQSATRAIGRDCYFWEVQPDPMTGMARWVRKTDDAKGDLRTGGECVAQVKCPNVIDPATLGRYTELEADDLLKQCTAVAGTATTETDTIKMLTEQAKDVGGSWKGTQAWTPAHSKIWYDNVLSYVGQKDLNAYIANAVKAAKTVKKKLSTTAMAKSTFAYILEAAVRSPENRADWIIDVVNAYNNKALTPKQATEDFFVQYLRGVLKPNAMKKWEAIIDNPKNF